MFELKKLGHELTVISRRKLDYDPQIRYFNGEHSGAGKFREKLY